MKPLTFPSCVVQVRHIQGQQPVIDSRYATGISSFYPPVNEPFFRACAAKFRYFDPELFGIHHEIAHHFLAHAMGLKHSRVVWTQAHDRWRTTLVEDEIRPWPYRVRDEEHLVNHLLLAHQDGGVDDLLLALWPLEYFDRVLEAFGNTLEGNVDLDVEEPCI